jgi:hypothetical protein
VRSAAARQLGVTEADLDDADDNDRSAKLTPAEKLGLRYADQMQRDPAVVTREWYEELHRHYTESQVMELARQGTRERTCSSLRPFLRTENAGSPAWLARAGQLHRACAARTEVDRASEHTLLHEADRRSMSLRTADPQREGQALIAVNGWSLRPQDVRDLYFEAAVGIEHRHRSPKRRRSGSHPEYLDENDPLTTSPSGSAAIGGMFGERVSGME